MYIVKIGNKKIYDPRIDELTLIEPIIELEENSAGSFSFTMPSEHPLYDAIERRKTVIQVFEDNDLLFSGMAYEVEDDFYHNKKVYCEGELSYFNDTIQRPAEYHDMTVSQLLEVYINNHNAQVETEKQFKLGMVTVHDSNDSIFCYTNMESTMQCIKADLVDDLGGIIRVRHANGDKYIDYITENEVNTNSQVIRLGENLIDYKSNISSMDIATAIIPLGGKLEESPIEALEMRLDIKEVNNGLDYVYDQVAVNSFGWIYKTVTWDDVKTASILKDKGEQYLSNTQFDNLVIEVKAVDLHLIDARETPFRLSDQIRIDSKVHGLKNKYFRLTKQTINLNNPENNTITLGKEEHLSLSARTNKANDEVVKAIESITPASTILKKAKENASALINGNGENGYVVLHENENGVVYEILVMDTPDINTATRVWRWNQNGLGFANSKDSSGNWQFGLAMTIDGAIVADYITTGTMNCDRLKGGTINGQYIYGGTVEGVLVKGLTGEIGGFTIGSDNLSIGDATLRRDRIGCGSAGYGIVNIVGNRSSDNAKYGYIQLSNSGNPDSCLDGIRIYGNGLVRRYDGGGNVKWERWLSNIPES